MTAEKYQRARQLDFFVATLNDISLRDQREVMERPFFALSKHRKTPIVYKSPKGDVTLEISPNVKHGMATIWDFDILIWAASQINQMIEQGDKQRLDELRQTKALFFQPADLLRAIDRGVSGRDRDDLRAALDRLASTYVKTNIRQHHQGSAKARGFTWLDSWDEETDTRTGHSKGMSITLSQWFLMGVMDQRMLLSMDADYFTLKGGYERWLYRIARKHAHGASEGWTFALSTLHEKSGSDQRKSDFKRDIKRVIERGEILGYGFDWIERGARVDPQVRIYPLPAHERNQALADRHAANGRKRNAMAALYDDPAQFYELMHPEKLRQLKLEFPRADLADMFHRFVTWNSGRGGRPKNIMAAFRGFIAKDQRNRLYG